MSPSVVLVHGLGGSAREWDAVAEGLRVDGVAVSVPELPGHGTRQDEEFRLGPALEAVTTAAASLVAESLDGSAPVLVGRALGGHLAIAVAGDGAPASAVIAAGIGTETLGWFVDSFRVASTVSQLLPDRGDAVHRLAGATFAGRDPAAEAPAAALRPDALDEVQRLDPRAALSRIAVPVVIANGTRDRFRLQERALLRASRAGRLHRVPGAAFAPPGASPTPLLPLIRDALGIGS